MNSYLVYRASFYLMLTVATTTLNVDTTDTRFNMLFPIGVALAGALAFVTVDQSPRWALPRPFANMLGLASLALVYLEYKLDETQLIRSLGHWVVYLQVIKYFLPKTAEDDWFLFLLGLTQVLIGSVINQSDQVGGWLFLWAMLAVWVLGQFFLQREAQRFLGSPEPTESISYKPLPLDPYRGLFDLPYAASTVRVLVVTLALGSFFFLLLPRQPGASRSRAGNSMARHLTGFDEEVQLGQLGEILENDSVVMSVELSDENRKPIPPGTEPLWRGVTLAQYDRGRWRRQSQSIQQSIAGMPILRGRSADRKLIRQQIKLEANDSATLFGIRPILEISAGLRLSPFLNPIDGTIFRAEPRGPFDYEVVSDAKSDAPQVGENPPTPGGLRQLLGMPDELKERFRGIALPLVQDMANEGMKAITARARALEAFLRDSGQFSYTLNQNVIDRNIDPVEDFLVNRKEGHCEYYASALALLLRSIDIPARVVNGFKGGDWNELTQSMTVRQKHAHSWVEAYAGNVSRDTAIWITLDPTPSAERDESVAQVGGLPSNVRQFTDLVRYIWVFYIVGYDSSRQNRLLYTPIRNLAEVVRGGYAILWRAIKTMFSRLFHFRDVGQFISIRGFLASFIILSLVAMLWRLLVWLGKRLLAWWRGPDDDTAGLTAGILFYRRLTSMLAEFNLERTTAETQNEFALRAARFLTGQGIQTQSVADVPQQVVEAFYRVRFGHRELDHKTLEELEQRLNALQASLNNP